MSKTNKMYLVTGAAGFLGSTVCRKLVSEESGCKQMKFFLPISVANLIAGVLEKKAKKTGEKPLMTTFSVYNLVRLLITHRPVVPSLLHNRLART